MRAEILLSMLPLFLLAACGGEGDRCADEDQVEVFLDADGDGFGAESQGLACHPGAGEVLQGGDCDDVDVDVRPSKSELCNGIDDDCDGAIDQIFNQHVFYQDLDQDQYGNEAVPLIAGCSPSQEWTKTGGDCDDANGSVNPVAIEVCGGGDEDCDGLVDQDDNSLDPASMTGFYPDEDLDGFGAANPVEPACVAPPKGGLVANNADCADRDPAVNPLATEVCDGGVDNDCDGLVDDLDDSIAPVTLIEFFADVDGDGAGDPLATVMLCEARPGFGAANDGDCNDAEALVSPSLSEVLCDVLDNDCDALTPDDRDVDLDGSFVCVDDCNDNDPSAYPGAPEGPGDQSDSDCDGLEECYQDVDGDGSRGETTLAVLDFRCDTAPNAPTTWPVDCDDADAAITWSGAWWSDADLDGFGDGVVALQQCSDPGAGFVLEGGEIDCDDAEASTFPGAPDACNDGIDASCDGTDSCTSCGAWLLTDGFLASGMYEVRPDGVTPYDVWCDMDTDGGGWTLVSSTFNRPPTDAATSYYADLQDLSPTLVHPGIWDGMQPVIGAGSDMRFACKLSTADLDFEVDLSFYVVDWYPELTAGTDAQSCFSEGGNPDFPPARRDNLTGLSLPAGDPYDGGALEGEDACNDIDDFTIDFDDRGMDGDQADGTDWGEDDGKKKCGVSEAGDAWFLFVR